MQFFPLTGCSTTPHEFIITGDFNIHLDNPTDTLTSQFLSMLSSINLTQLEVADCRHAEKPQVRLGESPRNHQRVGEPRQRPGRRTDGTVAQQPLCQSMRPSRPTVNTVRPGRN